MDLCPYGSICIHYVHTVCVAVQPLCSITLVNPIDAHCRSDRLCSVPVKILLVKYCISMLIYHLLMTLHTDW